MEEPDQPVKTDDGSEQVKAEPGEEPLCAKKGRAPANELPIFGEDELKKFRKEELVADVANLKGELNIFPSSRCKLTSCRTNCESQA